MSRSRNWVFTLNNPEPHENPQEWPGVKYGIYQTEIGENGTEHYQGYVNLTTAKGLTGVKNLNPRCHWEIRHGTHDQAKAYCSKEETRKDGTEIVEWGDEPAQGSRSDLESVRELINDGGSMLDIANSHFGSFIRYHRGFEKYMLLKQSQRTWKTKVTVIFGPPGTGKSHHCRTADPQAYWKPNGKWWDGYTNQETVIIDDFYGWIKWHQLLHLCDEYPLNVETKGSTVNFVAKQIFITSNKSPELWYRNVPAFGALTRRIEECYEMPSMGVMNPVDVQALEPPAPSAISSSFNMD